MLQRIENSNSSNRLTARVLCKYRPIFLVQSCFHAFYNAIVQFNPICHQLSGRECIFFTCFVSLFFPSSGSVIQKLKEKGQGCISACKIKTFDGGQMSRFFHTNVSMISSSTQKISSRY